MNKSDRNYLTLLVIVLLAIFCVFVFPTTSAEACDDGYQQPKVGDYSNGQTWDSNPKPINGGQGPKK